MKIRAERHQVPEHVGPDVRHHPLAEPIDEIEPCRARSREYNTDQDQHSEIAVDEPAIVAAEAEIDHPTDGKRHRQHRQGRNDHCHARQPQHSWMAQDVRPQRQQWPE